MKKMKVGLMMAALVTATVMVSFAHATSAAEPKAATKTGSIGCDMIKQDKATMVMQKNINLRNVAWAEVILWCGDGGTYNTMSLNDPKDSAPEALFKKLDKAKLAKEYQVTAVSTNPDVGRKFWTCDEFDIDGSPTVRDFNGLKARFVGTVAAGPGGKPMDLSAAGIQKFMYKPLQFNRVSTLIFQKGKPVFLLDDPNGTTWINKAYQTGVDPTLTYEGMATLDKHLKHLPKGWKFRSVVIDRDLVIKANGVQRIMWDELGNAYDALEPGAVNFRP
jgi:hypothetical protein